GPAPGAIRGHLMTRPLPRLARTTVSVPVLLAAFVLVLLGALRANAENLFVTFSSSSSVAEISPAGVFVRYVVPSGLASPTSSRFGPDGHLYVVNYSSGIVKKYDGETGTYIVDFVTGLQTPTDLVFDFAGDLYIAEETANRVSRYTSDGTFVRHYTDL